MRRLLSLKMFNVFMSALALAGLVFSFAPLTVASAAAQNNAEGGIQLQLIGAPSTAWVGVQFQFPDGTWGNIDAWTGPLNPLANGYVNFWVDPKDFGKGPFRWVVWDKWGGNVLAMSAPFYFADFATVVGTVLDFNQPIPLTGISSRSLGMAQDNAEGGIQLQLLNLPATLPYIAVQHEFNGTWSNVTGWTGPLDPLANGYVRFWVDPVDFGLGPYRWVVWDKWGGNVLAMSAPFNLPTYATVSGSVIDLAAH